MILESFTVLAYDGLAHLTLISHRVGSEVCKAPQGY